MASGASNRTKKLLLDYYVSATLKVMLVDSTYVHEPDRNFVDDGTADDPLSHEISVTGYTGGFGGAGRKALASKTSTQDDANDKGVFDAADLTWTALGTGATIGGCVYVEEVTNDADSIVHGFGEIADKNTNGGDFTLQFSTNGIIAIG